MSKKISICFYGITRNLKKTYPSIEENIINPAKKYGEVKIFCHFFNNQYINNKRSREINLKIEKNWDLIDYEELISDDPNLFLKEANLENIYKYGDPHLDNFKTIENLMHQLYSLKKVYQISEKYISDLTLFIRPDLLYIDSFESLIKNNLSKNNHIIHMPSWQTYRGLNDRFSICNSHYSAKIYANRIEQVNNYLKQLKRPVHGEELLFYAIEKSKAEIRFTKNRAFRVRVTGYVKEESFENQKLTLKIKKFVANYKKNKLNLIYLCCKLILFSYYKYMNFVKLKNFYRDNHLLRRSLKVLKNKFKKLFKIIFL